MIYDELFSNAKIKIPSFNRVYQEVDRQALKDIKAALEMELKMSGVLARVKKGDSVAITAGSREIDNIALILRTVCDELKAAGAKPFIIPAMGSHAGATASKQKALLKYYGITEESIGVPIKATMEVVRIGKTPGGVEVYFDKYASEADAIIPIGRIKEHTCFHGSVESGLMKMLAVGCGKQRGAAAMHMYGFGYMSKNIMEVARVDLEKLPVIFGIGIVENAIHQTKELHVLKSEDIEKRENEILGNSKKHMPRIPYDKIDILIVEEIGKNISGLGMDPNITGRSSPMGISRPFVERIAVLDISKESEGNGFGMGNADVITQRMVSKLVLENIYPNGITSHDIKPMMIPVIMPNDKTAVEFCLATILQESPATSPRIVWLHNTLCMESFYVSEALADIAVEGVVVEQNSCSPLFDENGGFLGMHKSDERKESK